MSWASEWRDANAKTVRRNRAQIQAGARQGITVAVLPFVSGMTAATLVDRPWDCECTWVPVFEGDPVAGYRASGVFRLKFGSRFCPVRSHTALSG